MYRTTVKYTCSCHIFENTFLYKSALCISQIILKIFYFTIIEIVESLEDKFIFLNKE